MSIYTKTGDKGLTSLYDGTRVKKDSDKVDAYGTIDELNSFVSLAEKKVKSKEIAQMLRKIQHQLFRLAGEIATLDKIKLSQNSTIITQENIKELETWIDQFTETVLKLNSFVLPGRTESAAQLHVARVVCRRAERKVLHLSSQEEIRAEVIQYLNRLSDCFYIFARFEDEAHYNEEVTERVLKKYLEATSDGQVIDCPQLDNIRFNHSFKILQRGIDKAKQLQVPVTIALVDESSHLIMQYRMDDALLVSIELAHKKAYTAIAMKTATQDLSQLSQPQQSLYQIETNTNGQIVTFAGGIPIMRHNRLVGAIGVSGGTVEEDQEIAEYAIHFEGEI